MDSGLKGQESTRIHLFSPGLTLLGWKAAVSRRMV